MEFDWSATGVTLDAVLVKQGSDKHNLYSYSPEAAADAGLGPQLGQTSISHVNFCWDTDPTRTIHIGKVAYRFLSGYRILHERREEANP